MCTDGQLWGTPWDQQASISQQNDSHSERLDGLMDVAVAGRTSRHSPARRHSMRAKDAQLDSHGLTRLWTMLSYDDELWWTMMNYDELCTVGSSNKTWHGLIWYSSACEAAIECFRLPGDLGDSNAMSGGASKDGGKRCYCPVPEPGPWGTFELCPAT